MTIENRGDLAASTAVTSEEMTTLLGAGPVAALMTSYVIDRPAS